MSKWRVSAPPSECKVFVDKNYVNQLLAERDREIKENPMSRLKYQSSSGVMDTEGSKNLYLEASIGKDERVFKLQHLVKIGKVKTLSDAVVELGVTEATVKQYLKELGIMLEGDEDGKAT